MYNLYSSTYDIPQGFRQKPYPVLKLISVISAYGVIPPHPLFGTNSNSCADKIDIFSYFFLFKCFYYYFIQKKQQKTSLTSTHLMSPGIFISFGL